MQSFQSGQYMRRRYNKILGDKYSSDKVYILSTDNDRAIMSAQALLAGLFKPTKDEIWNEEILWQPVSVHTLADESDTLLHGGKPCPKYDYLYEYFMERSPEALETMKKYGKLIAYWAKMSRRHLDTIEDVTLLYKRFMSDKEQHKKFVKTCKLFLWKRILTMTVYFLLKAT